MQPTRRLVLQKWTAIIIMLYKKIKKRKKMTLTARRTAAGPFLLDVATLPTLPSPRA